MTGRSDLRQWRFWCDGCSWLELHEFRDRERERLASVEWIKEHHGHGKGGFVTPEPFRAPCDRCGVGISASRHLCGRCTQLDEREDVERRNAVKRAHIERLRSEHEARKAR